jgi:hypothetical protein
MTIEHYKANNAQLHQILMQMDSTPQFNYQQQNTTKPPSSNQQRHLSSRNPDGLGYPDARVTSLEPVNETMQEVS